MKKIFKKSLAIMVSAAICLTALIGFLSVSAATRGEGTFTVGSDLGKPGELVTVPIELAYTSSNGEDGMGIAASLFDVSFDTDALTITDIAAGEDATYTPDLDGVTGGENVPPQDIYTVEYRSNGETISVVDGAVRILAMPADNKAVVTSMQALLTFTINDGAEAKAYDIKITKEQTCDFGTAESTEVSGAFGKFEYTGDAKFIDMTVTNGKVIVKDKTPTEPIRIDNDLLAHDLLLTETVGTSIAVNVSTKTGLVSLGYSDYYLVIDYMSYGEGYMLEEKSITLQPEQRDRENANGTVHYFNFNLIALYEMPLEYTVTIYLENSDGITVAYTDSVSSISMQALEYAEKYPSDTALLRALVDMINYGAETQNYFADLNPDSDIAKAALPTVGFEDYQQYASSIEDLPDLFNNTKETIYDVASTTLRASSTLIVGASNSISYSILATDYDVTNLKLEISYTDSYNRLITETVDLSDLEPNTSSGKVIYTYVFKKLAIYDLEKTVTLKVVDNGETQLTYNYSIGNFVNSYINNEQIKNVLTNMELFSQSARIKLVGA